MKHSVFLCRFNAERRTNNRTNTWTRPQTRFLPNKNKKGPIFDPFFIHSAFIFEKLFLQKSVRDREETSLSRAAS